jgi:hypothetical protein
MITRRYAIGALSSAIVTAQSPPAPPRPATGSKERGMVQIRRQINPRALREIALTPQPLRKTGPGTLPPAQPGNGAYTRRFGNIRSDSRVLQLADGRYAIAWSKEINITKPDLLLHGAGRLAVQGGGRWLLFSDTGSPVGEGDYGPSDISIDDRAGLLTFVNRLSFVQAHRLSDAKFLFRFSLTYSDLFGRPLLARIGDRMYAVGVEAQAFPHRPKPPNRSLIEFKQIGAPLNISKEGDLLSLTDESRIEIASAELRVAADEQTIVFSTPGCLYIAALDLNVQKAFTGDFRVEMMSRDERQRTYSVMLAPGGQRMIQVINDAGEVQVQVPLDTRYGPPIAPPAIGYDHRIYYAGRSMVAAFTHEGQVLWEHPARDCHGIGVMPSGAVLVSTGSRLLRCKSSADPDVVFEFPREKIATAPVVSGSNEVFVATEAHVYCLRRSVA